jgi:hypothetical protein
MTGCSGKLAMRPKLLHLEGLTHRIDVLARETAGLMYEGTLPIREAGLLTGVSSVWHTGTSIRRSV